MTTKKSHKATGKLHILQSVSTDDLSKGTESVAIESTAKQVPKDTKEYLDKKLEEVQNIRKETGKRNKNW